MRFELKVALRYLLSNRVQSALLIGGVAIAVMVFTFNAALINGLAEFQIQPRRRCGTCRPCQALLRKSVPDLRCR